MTTTTTGPAAAPTFTRSAFERFAATLWGPHAEAIREAGGVVSVCTLRGKGDFSTRAYPAPYDAQAVTEAVAQHASPTINTYVAINPIRLPERRENGSRGRGGDDAVLGVIALYADLDTADGIHAANVKAEKPLPTRAQVDTWVELIEREVQISLIVDTSGGLHIYVVLDEMLPATSPAASKLMRDFATVIERLAYRDGVFTDGASITCNPSRLLRPAGAWNAKRVAAGKADTGARVTLQYATDSAPQPYEEIEEGLQVLLAELPAVPAPESARKASKPSIPRDPNAPETAGDRFARLFPADWLLVETMGARRVKRGLALPRPDGSYDTEPSIQVYGGGDEPVCVTAFGSRSIQVLGQDDVREKHSLSSFALLAELWCGYDYKIAARLLHAFEGQEEALIPWLRYWKPRTPMPDELRKFVARTLAARPRPRTTRPPQQGAAA